MREIIGENLQPFFNRMRIKATKTYSGNIGYWPNFEVWEMSEEDYERICCMSEEQYEKVAAADSWWRGAEGSNMGTPTNYFRVNKIDLIAWCGGRRDDLYRDYFMESEEEQALYMGPDEYVSVNMPYEYRDLLEYFCEELGASTERNVCALAVDLAKYNNLTLSGLFKIYGGDTNGNQKN